MKYFVRRLIPNWIVNFFWHLPVAVFCSVIFGFPGRKLKVIGVTGTDGKTTTVNMIYEVLKKSGKKTAVISTLGAMLNGVVEDTGLHVTSPDPWKVQKYLRAAVGLGAEFAVLEVTSHALDQFRFWGIGFNVAVLTNVTREHLDYHKTMESYLKAKLRLFRSCQNAVLNADDPSFAVFKKSVRGKVVSYGLNEAADFSHVKFPFRLKLPGEHNVYNALAAIAALSMVGISTSESRAILESFDNIEGRLEEVKNDKGFRIFVDFAHTPNAIAAALKALREISSGRLIAVFGSAGDRDAGKRPQMGASAAKYADTIILTSDDPRFESPEKIMDEIAKGAGDAGYSGKNILRFADRREAIAQALKLAQPGDIVALLGKGHEKSMSIKGEEVPWSDRTTALEMLQKI